MWDAHCLLALCTQAAVDVGKDAIARQLATRKLTLIVDLDHTVVHAVPVETHPWVKDWCESDDTSRRPKDLHIITLPERPRENYVKVRPCTRLCRSSGLRQLVLSF